MSWVDPLLRCFEAQRVAVLGDMVADEYVIGRPSRISREAPVLILHWGERRIRPGGATNTAYNLRSLGAQTRVIGVIGDDEMGALLTTTLEEAGIDTSGLIVDTGRPTSTKTRIMAQGTQEVRQQIVRIDRLDDRTVDGALRGRLIDAVCAGLETTDALLISDYEHGVISSEVLEACLPATRRRQVKVFVDAHGDLYRFQGVTAATPNQPEAEGTLHRTIRDEQDLRAAGEELRQGMDAAGLLMTRGSEGIALFERDQAMYTLPVSITDESEVRDPTGAGDTVAAVFTLAVLAGAGMRRAAFLGNLAGGEVVRRLGAVAITPEQLRGALARTTLSPPA